MVGIYSIFLRSKKSVCYGFVSLYFHWLYGSYATGMSSVPSPLLPVSNRTLNFVECDFSGNYIRIFYCNKVANLN